MTPGGDTAHTNAPALIQALPDDSPDPRNAGKLREHFAEWRSVYLAWLVSRALVLAIGFGTDLYQRISGADPSTWRPFAHAETYPHYADVANNGYNLQNAFDYPLLPMLFNAGHFVGIPYAVTAFIVSNLAFLAALIGVTVLGARYVGMPAATRGAIYLAFMPFAYWFSIASTESMMLALAVGSVLLALRATPGAWMGAGVLAAGAALTRPPGALLGVLLLFIAIGQLAERRLTVRGVAAAVGAGLMIPAAVLSFFLFLRWKTGDLLASLHAQDQFNRKVTLDGPLKALTSGFQNALAGSIGQAIEVVATLGSAALIVWFAAAAAGNRWEIRGWTAFATFSMLMPLATGVLWQMPRFALLIPPVFWALGKFGERRALHYALLTLFPLALGVKVVASVIGVDG